MAQFAPPPAPMTPPQQAVSESGSLSAPPAPSAPGAPPAPPSTAQAPSAPPAQVQQAAPHEVHQAAPPAPQQPAQAPTYDEPPEQVFQAPQVVQAAPQPAPQAQAMAEVKPSLPMGPDGFPTGGSMAEVAAAMGFEGVNFDVYGVVPNITMNQGEFYLDKKSLGQEFVVRMGTSRKKHLLSYGPEDNKSLFYTYDLRTNANNGQSIEDFQREANGQPIKQSDYYEVSVTLDNGAIANLSIPIAGSGANFARFLAECFASRRRPQDVVVKVFRAPRVENTKFSFYPWGFEIIG